MDLQTAARRFLRAMAHCDNLATVHRMAGHGGVGRRDVESSVNGAIVVLAIAGWQGVAEDLARCSLEARMPSSDDPQHAMASLLAGQANKVIGDLNTPNAENVRRMLQVTGIDPRPAWTWPRRGRHGGRRTPTEVETELREWLKIRHAVAHGHGEYPRVEVLESVRQGTTPTVRLRDAQACVRFVRDLTQNTADALAHDLGVAEVWFVDD